MSKVRIGTFVGTGSNDIQPEITWRDQTKDEALRSRYDRFWSESQELLRQYVKERDAIEARYDDV
jgi:hypothetical protein